MKDIEAKRDEIKEHLTTRLFYLKNPDGNWDMTVMRLREVWYDEAELFLQRLASYGVMLVDKEARIAVSGYKDNDSAEFYYKTYPLMEAKDEEV